MTRPDPDAQTGPIVVTDADLTGAEVPAVDLAASNKSALSDGLALSISGAVGSVAGLISWILAARLMPQEAVGYASAFVSAFLLVAGVAQLNLDSAMMLWMPRYASTAPVVVGDSLTERPA